MYYPVNTKIAVSLLSLLATSSSIAQEKKDTQENNIEKIVVTAELIDRSLDKSGNSVEIFDQDTLKNTAGLNTLRDVLNAVGNISLVTGTGKAPTVRGVDGTGAAENANAFFAGSRQRLSWQIDGRPASYNEVVFADLSLFDVEKIEVLRGPQSSLVGRNAIAGTVKINTQNPVFEHQGKLRLSAGNDKYRQLAGMVNLPIQDDSLAVRISANWFKKDAQTSYDPYPGVDNPGEIEGKTIRGKLLYKPDTKLESSLLLNLTHSAYTSPNSEIIVRPFEDRRSNFPQQPQHKPETTSLIADYALALNDNWQLNINTSATDFKFTRNAVPETSNASINTKEYVLEPQLNYQNGETKAVMGVYYYQARQEEFIEFIVAQNFTDDTDTLAAYAEGILPLSSNIDLSLGLRYEHEDRTRQGGDETGAIVNVFSDEDYDIFLPKVGLNWQATENSNWGIQISKGYNAGGGGVTFVLPIVNYSYDEETVWTYEVYGRQEFMQGKIRTTQNVFFSDYKNMQLPFDLTPENSRDEAFVIRNANKVETMGLELGLTATVSENLNLWGNISLLDTEITDYPTSGVEGNELLTAPNFTARLGLSWQQNNWQAGINSRYSNSYYTDVNNRPGGETDPYTVLDAQLSYQLDDYRIFAVVNNLFDNDKPVSRYPGVAPADSAQPDSDFDSAVLLQARSFQIGIELSY